MNSKRSGFTLVELLMVISIISLLSTIVLASLNSARDRAQVAAGQQFDGYVYRAFGADARVAYDFDEGANTFITDKSGNSFNGTLSNASAWTTGIKGGGISTTNLSGGYVTINNNPAIFNDSVNGSLSMWIKPATVNNHEWVFTTGNPAGLALFVSGGMFRVYQNSQYVMSVDFSTRSNKWTHILVSWSDISAKLYINGKESSSTNSFVSGLVPGYADLTLYIGSDPGGNNRLGGTVDDFRIYGRSLQTAEIEKLYAEGLEKFEVAQK